jgi:diguanylate cyclase
MAERPIELGLTRPLDAQAPALAGLVDDLLALISRQALESQSLNTEAFRNRLQQFRQELGTAGPGAELGRFSHECSRACRDFFQRSAAFSAERDSELKGLVETLASAIDKLAGEAVSVNEQLSGHSTRFQELIEVEDIRDLKRRISHEVTALDRFVAEKQQRDEAHHSTLTKRIEMLQAQLVETEEAAALDSLTRIANRGAFDLALARWLSRARSNREAFVLALFDIDNFKGINDRFGHLVGDRVLLAAARGLSAQMRAGDLVARFGGEEFAILLAASTLRQAEPRLEGLLRGIAGSVYEFEAEGRTERLSYTMSAGAAESTAGDSTETILQRADEGLYEAKRRGKNCLVARKPSIFSRMKSS